MSDLSFYRWVISDYHDFIRDPTHKRFTFDQFLKLYELKMKYEFNDDIKKVLQDMEQTMDKRLEAIEEASPSWKSQ